MRIWIWRRRRRLRRSRPSRATYLSEKENARAIVRRLIAIYSPHYKANPRRLTIRNSISRWGSASLKGNLNFSFRIVYLPSELQEYIVVHELCHLLEHNHSARFWSQVSRTIPNHKTLRQSLRKWEKEHLSRQRR